MTTVQARPQTGPGASAAAPHIVRWSEVPAQPWRNGGGVTRELLAWPAGDEWQLRVSVADIDRSGPFSAFPGVSRWFVVLEGAGVVLTLPRGEVALQPGSAPCRFDGADAPACRLLDGPTRDLNLMLRGAEGALVPVVAGEAWRPGAARCGLFAAVAGELVVGTDGAVLALPAMSLCWWSEAPAELTFRPADDRATASPGWWLTASPGVHP